MEIHSKDLRSAPHEDACTLLIAAAVTVDATRRRHDGSITGRVQKGIVPLAYTAEYHRLLQERDFAIRHKLYSLEDNLLSEISQAQKEKNHLIYPCNLKIKAKYIEAENKVIITRETILNARAELGPTGDGKHREK